MKRIFCLLLLLPVFTAISAQIHTPVSWNFSITSSKSDEVLLQIEATIESGWHLYDLTLPAGGPQPTTLVFETLTGAETVGKPYATTTPTSFFDTTFELELRWFSSSVRFIQPLHITHPENFSAKGFIRYMTCNDESCLPPVSEPFALDASALPAIAASRSSSQKEIPEVVAPITISAPADTVETKRQAALASLPRKTENEPSVAPVVAQRVAPDTPSNPISFSANSSLWQPVTDSPFLSAQQSQKEASAGMLFFWGFLGGLLALLTPCVWPMIPMTVSFFLKRGKSRGKALSDALLYGASIVIIYLSLGILVTLLFGASALNALATNAFFNILFFALLLFFAYSFMGGIELRLPASWSTHLDQKADRTSGVLSLFFMAFTLVLVSFSCTGPIIGTLLVEAAAEGSLMAPITGMAGFAFALALPFALFALFPSLLHTLPKSGGWMNVVKVTLGFLELALSLKFLSVADLVYGWGILDREVFLVLWIVIFLFLGIFLLGKLPMGYDPAPKPAGVLRIFLSMISIAFSLYMIPGLWGAPLKAISAFTPPLTTQDFSLNPGDIHASFTDYDTGMAYAAQVNRPVLVNFSGYGCMNCRKMEASVWSDARVKRIIDEEFVLITLMVDDRTPLSAPQSVEENAKEVTLRTLGDRWSYLQRHKFGANAQPYYALLNPKGDLLAAPYAFNENISDYIHFLQEGIRQFNKEQ